MRQRSSNNLHVKMTKAEREKEKEHWLAFTNYDDDDDDYRESFMSFKRL
jgi:hypothetical protein